MQRGEMKYCDNIYTKLQCASMHFYWVQGDRRGRKVFQSHYTHFLLWLRNHLSTHQLQQQVVVFAGIDGGGGVTARTRKPRRYHCTPLTNFIQKARRGEQGHVCQGRPPGRGAPRAPDREMDRDRGHPQQDHRVPAKVWDGDRRQRSRGDVHWQKKPLKHEFESNCVELLCINFLPLLSVS